MVYNVRYGVYAMLALVVLQKKCKGADTHASKTLSSYECKRLEQKIFDKLKYCLKDMNVVIGVDVPDRR